MAELIAGFTLVQTVLSHENPSNQILYQSHW
jgi:hypothetical protein